MFLAFARAFLTSVMFYGIVYYPWVLGIYDYFKVSRKLNCQTERALKFSPLYGAGKPWFRKGSMCPIPGYLFMKDCWGAVLDICCWTLDFSSLVEHQDFYSFCYLDRLCCSFWGHRGWGARHALRVSCQSACWSLLQLSVALVVLTSVMWVSRR